MLFEVYAVEYLLLALPTFPHVFNAEQICVASGCKWERENMMVPFLSVHVRILYFTFGLGIFFCVSHSDNFRCNATQQLQYSEYVCVLQSNNSNKEKRTAERAF